MTITKAISVLTGLILFISQSSIAQDATLNAIDEEGSHKEIGGFFSFDSKLSTIHGENVWFSGGTFGLVYEHTFFPDAPVQITITILLAGGKVTIKREVPLSQVTFHTGLKFNCFWAGMAMYHF